MRKSRRGSFSVPGRDSRRSPRRHPPRPPIPIGTCGRGVVRKKVSVVVGVTGGERPRRNLIPQR